MSEPLDISNELDLSINAAMQNQFVVLTATHITAAVDARVRPLLDDMVCDAVEGDYPW